jgi:hypothetical protein
LLYQFCTKCIDPNDNRLDYFDTESLIDRLSGRYFFIGCNRILKVDDYCLSLTGYSFINTFRPITRHKKGCFYAIMSIHDRFTFHQDYEGIIQFCFA